IVGMSAWADRKVSTYSKGMMQRVGLAQAMMNEPDLIVLDEPTDGVDPVGRHEIRNVLSNLRTRGTTVFINSHLLSELEMVCDRVAILVGGMVSQQGTVDELALGKGFYEVQIAGELCENDLPPALKAKMSATMETLRIETTDPTEVQPLLDALRSRGV